MNLKCWTFLLGPVALSTLSELSFGCLNIFNSQKFFHWIFQVSDQSWRFSVLFSTSLHLPLEHFWWSSLPSCAEMYTPTHHTLQLEREGWVALTLIPRGAQQRPQPPAHGALQGGETLDCRGWVHPAFSHSLPFSELALSAFHSAKCSGFIVDFESSPGRSVSPLSHSHPMPAGLTELKDHRNRKPPVRKQVIIPYWWETAFYLHLRSRELRANVVPVPPSGEQRVVESQFLSHFLVSPFLFPQYFTWVTT